MQAFFCVLQQELKRVPATSTRLREGIENVMGMMSILRVVSPWEAKWPPGDSAMSLTSLMAEAARANCELTAAFLYEAGGQASLCSKSCTSPLHTALKARHWKLATRMVTHMRGCIYIPDAQARLPTDLMSRRLRQELEQVSYCRRTNI